MLKTELISQSKVSARGYIEIRSTVRNVLALALVFSLIGVQYKRLRIFQGVLALEFAEYLGKVLDYRYQPTHGRNRGARGGRNPIVREVLYFAGIRHTGGHRLAA